MQHFLHYCFLFFCMEDSSSGIILPGEQQTVSPRFTDITPLAGRGYCQLSRARRYGRWWVLKSLRPEYAADENFRLLLRKEFEVLVSLQHPNIVSAVGFEPVADLGECIVMEWIDGCTFGELLAAGGIGVDEKLKLFLQLLSAVEYIHGRQIVHRDLKLSNVMVTHNGHNVKLIDFGLADSDSYAVFKQPAGTPGYMSPEQASGRCADVRNDIYSLGCVLEDMHVGRRYAAVIARCKASAAMRYAGVAELRRAVERAACRRVKSVAVVVTVAAVACVSVFVGGYLYNNIRYDRTSVPSPVAVKPHKDSVDRAGAEKKPVGNVPGHARKQPPAKSVPLIISWGKKHIDTAWKNAGVAEAADEVTKSNRFYAFYDECTAFVMKTCPQSLKGKVGEEQLSAITLALSEYMAAKYVRPTMESFRGQNSSSSSYDVE